MSIAPATLSVLGDPDRVRAVRATGMLDGDPAGAGPALERLTRVAGRALDVSLAAVTVLDDEQQTFLSTHGPLADVAPPQMPSEATFCRHVIEAGAPLVIDDLADHPLGADPVLRLHGIDAYAGIPLRSADGHIIGTLCVMDQAPRAFGEADLGVLADLAACAAAELLVAARHSVRVVRPGDEADEDTAPAPESASGSRSGDDREVAKRLGAALDAGALEVHFQPIVALPGADRLPGVHGFEALVRWTDPELGSVPPCLFVPVAERSELIDRLGAFVVDEVCGQLARWADAGLRAHVAVNVSPLQVRRPDFAAGVAAALARHRVPRERVYFELTETAVMEDGRAEELLAALDALGTELSIDDFGTGQSSLSRLRDLPFHALKLDRSFLRHIPGSQTDADVVVAVLQLAGALGMTCVAEGVETEEQHAFLVAHGCPFAQGWLYGRAVPAAEAEAVMRSAAGTSGALRAA